MAWRKISLKYLLIGGETFVPQCLNGVDIDYVQTGLNLKFKIKVFEKIAITLIDVMNIVKTKNGVGKCEDNLEIVKTYLRRYAINKQKTMKKLIFRS